MSNDNKKLNIIIISGTCCNPAMASLDKQARSAIEKTASETGISVEIKVIPATSAFFGGIPKDVRDKLLASGGAGLPVILINGKAVSYGVPKIGDLKSALLQVEKEL
ncbi:hypothetical protein KJ813_02860 [bacterium]|nr:hypothetical protein [bacterium]MBU4602485.1 hypothetical protein [bacterium]